MSVARIGNLELDSKIKTLAQKERALLNEVLIHIYEADRRKLYLDFAYPSLFSYLTEGCGYSGSAAHRRIEAARLMVPVPEVAEKIKSGEISLAQISILQKAIRQKNKNQTNLTEKVSTLQKRKLVRKLCSKSMAETQKIIAQELDIKIQENQKETHQKDESVRLELTFTKEQWGELLAARDLLSNVVNSSQWNQVFSYLAKKVIQKKKASQGQKERAHEQLQKSASNPESAQDISTQGTPATTSAAEVQSRAPRPVPNGLKKKIFNRDQTCQYRDKNSGRVCGSRWNLEIDHIQPRWANGGNEEDNLRVLCQKHNQYIYRKQAGIFFASKFKTA